MPLCFVLTVHSRRLIVDKIQIRLDKHELSGFAIHLILTHSVELFSLCHPVDVNVVVWDGKSPVER